MGKMILLIVLGSYFIIGSIMKNNSDISTDTVENVVGYYTMANVKHIAVSGANLAVANVYRDKTWRAGYKNKDFSYGNFTVTLKDEPSFGQGGVRITSIGNYMNHEDSVIVDMNLEYFSKYLYYADKFPAGGYFVTGDTIAGRFHTNGTLNVSGRPVFLGRVSMLKGPVKKSDWFAKADPQFIGGYDYGVYIPMPPNLDALKTAANVSGYYSKKELWITLNNNNTVSIRTSKFGVDSTYKIADLTSNGVLFSEDELHVKGKISGRLTLASAKDIWVDDDLGVVNDPRTDPNSKDFLGICTEKDLVITDNFPNSNDVNIVAAVYTGGSLEAEHYNTRPNSGYINLFGSLAQESAGFTGSGAGKDGKVKNGFNESYKYDERLIKEIPPHFPVTDRMQILAWWE